MPTQPTLFEPPVLRRGLLALILCDDGRALLELRSCGAPHWLELLPADRAWLVEKLQEADHASEQ